MPVPPASTVIGVPAGFTTQSITPVMQAVRSVTQPGAARLVNSGQTIAVAGLLPIADIHIGTLTVPTT